MKTSNVLVAAVVVTVSTLFTACVQDHQVPLIRVANVTLSPDQEVPPKNSPAMGTANVVFDRITHVMSYTVTWNNLTGNPIGSHIHGTAPRGRNAGIRHDFTTPLPKTTSGTFSNSVMVDGVAIKEDSLLAGFYYFNIHTPANPGGEIRGQIEF
ncbi:CHRD domain-containing protein [Nibrella saemangeumensis]|uniref:CHRD domain-containing protein n=1 Tax=Nibrella saemangeumensis TaxID=1084526 RepID=A0ABP8MR80_9BACT